MNDTSMVTRSIGSGRLAAVSPRAFVRSIETTRGSARSDFGELSATHVESVDPARAALQQDVGETAGRRADVERDEPGRVDLEGVERGRELVTAAADVGVGRDDGDGVAASSRSPGFRSWRAASPSPTLTLPASTSAWARLRDSTRPRSTSS